LTVAKGGGDVRCVRKRATSSTALVREQRAVVVSGARIEYALVRSPKRKRTLQLTFDVSEGVVVRAPMRASEKYVEDFVKGRAPWITRVKGHTPGNGHHPRPLAGRQFVTGETLLYLGRELRLEVTEKRVRKPSVHLGRGVLRVSVPIGLNGQRRPMVAEALEAWYRERADAYVQTRVERWTSKVGYSPARVIVRDQKTRWGSCSPDGTLRFNWRLVMAEPKLVDYVVVHELAHLGVRDHSWRFWDAVGAVLPDYKELRAKLREAAPYLAL
jgi:predicted metal-dependent hydrolase